MKIRNPIPLIALLCALGTGVAACGSSGSSPGTTPSAPSTPAPATSAPSSSSPAATGAAAAEKAIKANWTAFFDPKTPVAKRISLLQNGQKFASLIQAQAGSSLASSASAKVTKVTVTSPTQATVTYSLLLGGTPALSNQKGVAVLQGGTWKVGDASFCGLMTLENGGTPPAVCKSVS